MSTDSRSDQPIASAPTRRSVLREAYGQVEHLVHEIAKFGVVGLLAFVIDVGLFNLLMFAGGTGPLNSKPLTAKCISVVVATTFSYFGNRNWTFRDRGRTGFAREYVLFFVLNGIALLIAIGCLWFTHYALGLTSVLADNISANVIGLGLGTLFRFWSYRKWVFPDEPVEADEVEARHRDAVTPI